jgi:regulator of protease activity HflC (stomatin/prohibitin superfamily)
MGFGATQSEWVITVLALCAPPGCATIEAGHAAIVEGAGSATRLPLAEGWRVVGPFVTIEDYDLRAQERNEDLEALSADGMRLEAKAAVMTFRPVASEVSALAREIGPDYYGVLISPTVRSRLRRILAAYRADQLDTPTVDAIERELTQELDGLLRPHHIVFDSISLHTLRIDPSSLSYRAVLRTGVEQQKVMTAREMVEVVREQAEARRVEARGIAAGNAVMAPTLTPELLGNAAIDAWSKLLTSPAAHTTVLPPAQPYLLEVFP